MTESYFSTPKAWRIPPSAFSTSLAEMANDGKQGNEGIAFWLGTREKGVATVKHIVGLRGPLIFKAPLAMRIHASLVNDLTDLALELGMILLGHIHAHPGTFIDMSDVDRTYGISTPGYLSAIAPYYATRPDTAISECSFHVFERGTGYRRFTVDEVSKFVHPEGGEIVPITILGG